MAMGGVGEAALLGAAMGGGSALLTGGDPLKGALLGTLTGGAGAGISSLLPGATAATTVLPQIAPAVATETAVAATLPEVIASNAANAVTSQVVPAISPTASALPNFPTSATPIPPYVPQPAGGGISDLLTRAQSLTGLTGGGSSVLTGGVTPPLATPPAGDSFLEGMGKFAKDPIASIMSNKPTAIASALAGTTAKKKKEEEEEYTGPLSRFKYNPDAYRPSGYADGGIASLGAEGYDRMVGEQPMYQAMAHGGIADLGSYSDGGRMLKGPGDGMSDNIPATIAGKRPARLADGEFVVPADVVSHLGNGSTDAGAKQLYAMMNKVRQARTGRKAQGREINPRQYVPA